MCIDGGIVPSRLSVHFYESTIYFLVFGQLYSQRALMMNSLSGFSVCRDFLSLCGSILLFFGPSSYKTPSHECASQEATMVRTHLGSQRGRHTYLSWPCASLSTQRSWNMSAAYIAIPQGYCPSHSPIRWHPTIPAEYLAW